MEVHHAGLNPAQDIAYIDNHRIYCRWLNRMWRRKVGRRSEWKRIFPGGLIRPYHQRHTGPLPGTSAKDVRPTSRTEARQLGFGSQFPVRFSRCTASGGGASHAKLCAVSVPEYTVQPAASVARTRIGRSTVGRSPRR